MMSRTQSVQKFKVTPNSTGSRWSKGKTTVSDARTPPGRDGTGKRPPGHRPPHRPYPPGIGPIGPAIGTGVLIGTLGPAGAGTPPNAQQQNISGPPGGRGGINVPPGNERRFVEDEVVLEFANDLPPQGIAQLLARNGLRQIEAQRFTLSNSTLIRARIFGARSVRATLARLGNEAILRTGQPNYYLPSLAIDRARVRYRFRQVQNPADACGRDRGGAAVARRSRAIRAQQAKNLREAHELATGDRFLIAVINSGIDLDHPELQGVIAGSYDALGKPEAAHRARHRHRRRDRGPRPAARRSAGGPHPGDPRLRRLWRQRGSDEASTVVKGVEYAATHARASST